MIGEVRIGEVSSIINQKAKELKQFMVGLGCTVLFEQI